MKTIPKMIAFSAGVTLCAAAHASFVLNTGTDANNDGRDDNWVLRSVAPNSPLPPGNRPDGWSLPGPAYLVATVTFPLDPVKGPWVLNDPNSTWISYASPVHIGAENTYNYTYRLVFSTIGGSVPVRWLSDNSSNLYLDGVLAGSRPQGTSFAAWNTPVALGLSPGMHTLDLEVRNLGQMNWGNPTGVRVEFPDGMPVPEPATVLFGALLLLPFGASTLRWLYRSRA
jgi:hypothetical protein